MFGINEHTEPDALDLLKQDHAAVDALFKDYEDIKDSANDLDKSNLTDWICAALTVHATIEEEIFYPSVRGREDEVDALLNEAAVEHQSLKDIISRLAAAPVTDPLYDAGVKVLAEYVKHHVQEEEGELFPKVRKLGIDLGELGQRLKARRDQLEHAHAQSMQLPQSPNNGDRANRGHQATR